MTALLLLQICTISSCSHALLQHHQRHLNSYKALVANRRTTTSRTSQQHQNNTRSAAAAGRQQRRHRRAHTHSNLYSTTNITANSNHKRRRVSGKFGSTSIVGLNSQPRLDRHYLSTLSKMESNPQQHIRRRSSVATRSSSNSCSNSHPSPESQHHKQQQSSIDVSDNEDVQHGPPRVCRFSNHAAAMQLEGKVPPPDAVTIDSEAMPPPPLPASAADDDAEGRSSRSTSNASRNTNRLSLTLPVAPPTSDPSRPASTVTTSFPATPVEPATANPVDANDFIIAIAAQERRVLELREELGRAESDLARLKRQWAAQETYQKRTGASTRPLGPQIERLNAEEAATAKRSSEIDRRKTLLQSQGTPNHRRRVMRGGHTRTLSLLSPTKSDTNFSVHEDLESLRSPDITPRPASVIAPSTSASLAGLASSPGTPTHGPRQPPSAAALAKRASWQPRAYNPNQQGVKQMAEDFKSGLWSFMEDIRQATVGDEPITGHPQQGQQATTPGASTPEGSSARRQRPMSIAGDQDTIKALSASLSRGNAPLVPTSLAGTLESSALSRAELNSRTEEAKNSRNTNSTARETRSVPAKAKSKAKHFSWTPLSVDTFDDNDWSNWESPPAPSSKSSARWSGSTVSGGDGIAPIPERTDENETPLKKKGPKANMTVDTSRSDEQGLMQTPIMSPAKLEEILPNVVNRLTPSNIKRTANSLMDEWEKSLTPPQKQGNMSEFEIREDLENQV